MKQTDFFKSSLMILLMCFGFTSVWGQISISSLGEPYTQDFNSLGASGTTFPLGWAAIDDDDNSTLTALIVTDGGASSGNVYNVGSSSSTERALGSLASGSTQPFFGAQFINNTGQTITELNFSGVMEQWRSGANAVVETLPFEYSLNATSLQNSSFTWIAITGMDLVEKLTSTTTAAAVNGNLPANKTSISGNVTGLNIPNGATFWIRWKDSDNSGSDGLYAIDDFQLIANAPSTDPTLTADPTSLSGFTFTEGFGPSESQSFTLTGSNLNGGDVTVTAPTGYVFSTIPDGDELSYNSTLTLSDYGDAINQTFYVRLAAESPEGEYNGNIAISGGGAEDINVALSGSVTGPPVVTEDVFTGTVDIPFSQQVIATGNPTNYEVSEGSLPGGLSLDSETGAISGTPTTAGAIDFGITATYNDGSSDTGYFTIDIAKGTQTATLDDINAYIGDADISLPAATDQGITINYFTENENVVTIDGNIATIIGTGTANVTAENIGDDNYEAFTEGFTITVTEAPEVYEDFSDGDFTSNPVWSGDTTGFTILTNSTIPDGNASTDGSFLAGNPGTDANYILTTPSAEVSEWQFSLATNAFSPSGANYFGVILMASNEVTGDISLSDFTGYYLKLGANGSDDKIELWRKTGAGQESIGDFNVNVSSGLPNGLNIRITRDENGTFELFHSTGFTLDETPTTSAGTLTNNVYTTSSYFGVYQAMVNSSRRVYFDNLMITPPTPAAITWLATNEWSNTDGPTIDDDAIVEGDLVIDNTLDLQAKNFTISTDGSVTIQDGGSLTLSGKLTNNATATDFVVESGGNLVQNTDYTADDNEGAITVQRNSQDIVRLDYTMWSSPVKNQQLQEFSPTTLPNRIYTYETNSTAEGNHAYTVVTDATADFTQGKGYLFRAPNDWPIPAGSAEGDPYEGVFTGEPTNGNVSVATFNGGYTSIGNPYPSNIDPALLMAGNSDIIQTIYFWNNPARVETSPGSGEYIYTGTKYVAFTSAGYSPSQTNSGISVGQGFIVYSTADAVNFDNSMRVTAEENFFKTDAVEHNRFWLSLQNDNQAEYNQLLVNYMSGATNEVDQQIDAQLFGYSGSAIYNLINEEAYVIQGRALPFADTDVVPLGFKAEEAGKFIVSLANFDGLFAEGEAVIYLKDKELDTVHNLMESDYDFESVAGTFNERFEVIYSDEGVMNVDDLAGTGVMIYKNQKTIEVKSNGEQISSVEAYDLQGRLIHNQPHVNAQAYQFETAAKGVLVIRVKTADGKTISKKIIN